jgi:hypothetical protein
VSSFSFFNILSAFAHFESYLKYRVKFFLTEDGRKEKGKRKKEKGKRKMPGSLNLSTVPEFLLITIMSNFASKVQLLVLGVKFFVFNLFNLQSPIYLDEISQEVDICL